MRRILLCLALSIGAGCSSPKPIPPSETVLPRDEAGRFPEASLSKMRLVPAHLLEKSFMPGGNLATYAQGYQLFLGKMPDAQSAAFLLLDWKKELKDSRYLPHMGGYFGMDGARPVYVFTKGSWIAGVAGLPEAQADPIARVLAGRL